jgi:hypothetical protein
MHKEIPILFSTPMVQAILEGRKTMTRRIVKFPKDFTGEVFNNAPYGLKYSSNLYGDTVQRLAYALPNDLLWVRESFFDAADYKNAPIFSNIQGDYIYKTDTDFIGCHKWKPSIHMPKAAARIWLEVTHVTAQLLHDITEEDAIAEGIEQIKGYTFQMYKNYRPEHGPNDGYQHAPSSFMSLWKKINGEASWNANPWVWVVSFKVLSTAGKPALEKEATCTH